MTTPCEICDSLSAQSQDSCSSVDLEKSSRNGCAGCSLLFNASRVAMKHWLPSYASSIDPAETLMVRWRTSSSRGIFKLEIVDTRKRQFDQPKLTLQLHAAPGIGSGWDTIRPARLVTPDSDSDEGIEKIKYWLQTCRSSHPKCNGIKSEWAHRIPVPARRLIDVGSSTRPPRLIEEALVRGYYVTLSHCWGRSSPLITTKATLHQHLGGISMDDLPPTFQDAVKLVRALGIQYIWIDSLCIVQDDEKEWRQEASRMGDIYGSSYLTIAATAAIDSSKGIFSRRPGSLRIANTDVFVRKKIDHTVFKMPVLDALTEVGDGIGSHKYPLFQRGWCLQERLLSNRILHFTSDEMVWQCRSCDQCECEGIQLLENVRSGSHLTSRLKYNRVVEGNSGSDIWTIWREIVEDYCSTQLTKDGDHLPALSGVAAKFGLSGAGTYIAGLWHKPGALSLGSSPLFLDLLWKSRSTSARRPRVKVAPSFSWASRMGPIIYRSEARDGPLQYQQYTRNGQRKFIHKCIFVVQLTHKWDNSDHFADAPNAKLEIRCQLLPCSAMLEYEVYKIVLKSGFEYEFTPDVANTVLEETHGELYCMPVAAYENHVSSINVFDGLVLVKISPGNYRRVGLAEGLSERWLDEYGHESITLV